MERQKLHTKKNRSWDRWLGCLVIFLIFLFLMVWVDRFLVDQSDSNRKSYFVHAKVVQLLQDNTQIDETTEMIRKGSQEIIAEITSGSQKGKQYMVTNYMSVLYNIDAQPGTHVILRIDKKEDGGENLSIYSYDRAGILLGCLAVFGLLLCIIGGKKGFFALASLAFTLVCVWKLMIPMMLYGVPVLLAAILVVILSTCGTFLLVDGINKKTVCAAVGTISGVVVAGIFAVIVGALCHITGYQTTESEELLLTATDHGMKLKNLFTAGILISALGAVMDVAMSIASAIHELKQVNPALNAKELFRSGMNIGHDAMGTMANTLILAFTGSSLTLILLVYSYEIPFIQLINTDLVAREVIQGIAGSIGIVLTVPIVALLSSFVESTKGVTRKQSRETQKGNESKKRN